MTKRNTVAEYSLQTTLDSYDKVANHLNKIYGQDYAKKNPGVVSCLLRFQEELIRSTSDLISKDKLDIKSLDDLTKS